MGFGSWLKHRGEDAVHVVDKVGDTVEHVAQQGEHLVGEGVDKAAHLAGDGLDEIGAHGAADSVDKFGDSVADHLGADVPEQQLGESDDPKQLVHGDAGAINDSVGKLETFASGFGSAASALRDIDTSGWQGAAADSFHATYAKHPQLWQDAEGACSDAAAALTSYAHTVTWAQGQAQEAIDLYRKGQQASTKARDDYNKAVDSYNSAADHYNSAAAAGHDPGPKPTKPGDFSDPGVAMREHAQEILTKARRQRDDAASSAQSAVSAATDKAPQTPSFHDRMLGDAADLVTAEQVESGHFVGGIAKGTGDLVRFARSVNITDPYNLTHPAQYLDYMSSMSAGLLHATQHPTELVKAIVGSGWSKDPAEAAGKLVPQILLAVGTDGAGTAADAGADAAERVAVGEGEDLAERTAVGMGEQPGALEAAGREESALAKCGDPVDAATGVVFLEQVDLELPGVLPLVVRRRHLSSWRLGHWFGPTWASTLDERLDVGDDGVMFVRGDGVVLSYPHPGLDEPVLPSNGAAWAMLRTETGGYRITDPTSGQVRHFVTHRGGSVRLAAVTDPTGHRVMFARDRFGTPVEVRHTGGYRLLVDTADGRVTGFAVAHADGSQPTRIADYSYTDGHLTSVVNASGEALRFGYDDQGRLTHWHDRNGTEYSYRYDDRGRCVAQGGSDGFLANRFAYLDGDRPGERRTVVTDSLGATTTYHVNERFQVVAQVDPLGRETRFEWDDEHRLRSLTDPLGHITRYRYDAAGRLVELVRPDGLGETLEYDGRSTRLLPTAVTRADGTTFLMAYDAAGNRVSVTDPAGATTRFGYDGLGHLASVTDARGATRTFETDGAGLPVAVTEPDGATRRMVRDAFGRPVEVTDPIGATTRLSWTADGRLAARGFPDESSETWTYDGEGNLVEHVDAAGGVTTTEHTHFDLPISRTGPDGATTRMGYDTELRLCTVTNARGLTWTYDYDAAGQIVAETDFDGRTQRYSYDPAGRLVETVNGAGEVVAFERDRLGHVVRRRAGAAVTELVHDPMGRLVRATNPDVELVLQRDVRGLVVAEVSNGRTLRSTYDATGRRTRRVTPGGVETMWAFDASGRTQRVTVDRHELRFERDAAGREVRRHLGGAAVLEQLWDDLGQLTGQTLATPGGIGSRDGIDSGLADRLGTVPGVVASSTGGTDPAVMEERRFAYADGGRLVGVEDRSGSRNLDLDPAGRVTGVRGGAWQESYAYDVDGNLIQARGPSDGAAAVRGDFRGTRLVRSGPTRFGYDAQGRLTSRTVTRLSRKPDVWRFEWDAEDRMTGVRTPDGTQWRYVYDALGRRVAKQRLSADDGRVVEQVDFVWDGMTLAEQTESGGDEAEATTSWVHEGLAPLVQVETPRSGPAQQEVDARFFAIVTDLVGAPTELLDEAGDLVWRARRTLWGAPAGEDETRTPLRFPGQYVDAETGLFYNVHRYYDPSTARYVSQDPLGLAPAPNPTAYVDNPTAASDPLGLFTCDEVKTLAEQHITNSGDTVLGSYDGLGGRFEGYISKAERTGSSYFDVGDKWSQLDDPWKANTHFLDTRIQAGDRILLSVPKTEIEAGTYLSREIEHVTSHGYKWVNQWALRPGG